VAEGRNHHVTESPSAAQCVRCTHRVVARAGPAGLGNVSARARNEDRHRRKDLPRLQRSDLRRHKASTRRSRDAPSASSIRMIPRTAIIPGHRAGAQERRRARSEYMATFFIVKPSRHVEGERHHVARRAEPRRPPDARAPAQPKRRRRGPEQRLAGRQLRHTAQNFRTATTTSWCR